MRALSGIFAETRRSPHISHDASDGWFSKVHLGQANPEPEGDTWAGRIAGETATEEGEDCGGVAGANACERSALSIIAGCGLIPQARHGGIDDDCVTPGE